MAVRDLFACERRMQRDNDQATYTRSELKHGDPRGRFPDVRYWTRQNETWCTRLMYKTTAADGIEYHIDFRDFMRDVIIYAVKRQEVGYAKEVHFTLRVPDGVEPWELCTLRQFAYYKRLAAARMQYRKVYPYHLRDRFCANSSTAHNLHKVVQRHHKMRDQVQTMYLKATNSGDIERKKGWARVLRHVNRDPGLIAYSQDSIECMDGMVTYPRHSHSPVKRRVKAKMSKIIVHAGVDNGLTGLMYQDWIAEHKNNWRVDEVSGKDIEAAYLKPVGMGSCMTGCEELISLYTVNPDNVHMLILYEDGRATGRALLWKLDPDSLHKGDLPWMLDRTYPQCDKTQAMYRKFADDRGDCYIYGFKHAPGHVKVTLNPPPCAAIPYMDTWGGMDIVDKKWVLSMHEGDYSVCCTEGGPFYSGEGRVHCCNCEDSVHEDEAVSDGWDFWCQGCYNDNFGVCDRCEDNTPVDNLMTVEGDTGGSWCESCVSNHSFYCEECHTQMPDVDRDVHDEGMIICQDCFKDNYVMCYGCSCATPDDETTEHTDGQLYCVDCASELESEGGV